jgi:hypothetical protein
MRIGPNMFTARDGSVHFTESAAALHDFMRRGQQPRRSSSPISSILTLCIVALVIWALANGYGKDIPGLLRRAVATKSWCMGLQSQIQAREASQNPMARTQIPPIRQLYIESGCQS